MVLAFAKVWLEVITVTSLTQALQTGLVISTDQMSIWGKHLNEHLHQMSIWGKQNEHLHLFHEAKSQISSKWQ